MKVLCDYCRKPAKFCDSKIVYGKSRGMIYYCGDCNAYVGVHKGTDIPRGRMANAELRYWKREAHAAFDPLWQYGRFKGFRNVAYGWLARRMNLPMDKTHISLFDVAQCKKVVSICRNDWR